MADCTNTRTLRCGKRLEKRDVRMNASSLIVLHTLHQTLSKLRIHLLEGRNHDVDGTHLIFRVTGLRLPLVATLLKGLASPPVAFVLSAT